MKSVVAILIFYYLIPCFAFCQTAPSIQWQNTIGGGSSDNLTIMRLAIDGGFILGGSSASNISYDKNENCIGDLDYWIIKTDAFGNLVWQNTIGSAFLDALNDVNLTSDNGCIIGGYSSSGISGDKTDSSRGSNDYWILKLDSLGDIEWQKTIGGNSPNLLHSLKQTIDGGYILGGTSLSDSSGEKTENKRGGFDYWIIKLDSTGNIQWQRTIGGSDFDQLRSIDQTMDRGFILAGDSYSNISDEKAETSRGSNDYWIIKLDSTGFIQWQKTIGGNSTEVPTCIKQVNDGGYIVAGESYSNISGDKTVNNVGGDDFWIIKLSSIGVIQWQKSYGGYQNEWCLSAIQTSDNGYLFGGPSSSGISGNKTESLRGVDDYWIIKTDSIGNIQWQKTLGSTDYDELHSAAQTLDGGYILGGASSSPTGFEKTENCLGLCYWDYWIIKLSPPVGIPETNFLQSAIIAPNPLVSTSILSFKNPNHQKVKVSIYNIIGKLIEAKETIADNLLITKGDKPHGIYLASITNEKTCEVCRVKFIVE